MRKVGDTPVHPMGLGCMNLSWAYGPATENAAAEKLIHRALDLGCNFFDTATIYGQGENEKLVARALGARRKDVLLASKCVLMVRDGQRVIDGHPDSIKQACDASLQRLGTDVIDLYYLHRPDPKVPVEDSIGALSELVAAGKIRMIGMSEFGADMLRRAHAVHPVSAMQSEYSLWVRNPEIAVKDACAELGVTLVAFSPVGRGFLADPPADPASFDEADLRRTMFPRFFPENYSGNLPLLDEARACAAETGCTVAQLALAWTLAKGEHIVAIPGTTKIAHLEDNMGAADVTLSPDIIARLDKNFAPGTAVGPRSAPFGMRASDSERFAFEEAFLE